MHISIYIYVYIYTDCIDLVDVERWANVQQLAIEGSRSSLHVFRRLAVCVNPSMSSRAFNSVKNSKRMILRAIKIDILMGIH